MSPLTDCCRAKHFVTIRDSDDGSSSDSDTSNENASFVVGSASDGSVETADIDSLPAVGVAAAASVAAAGSSSDLDWKSAAAKKCCRVHHSPEHCDTVNGSPPTASSRTARGSLIRTSSARGHCQHIRKIYCYYNLGFFEILIFTGKS